MVKSGKERVLVTGAAGFIGSHVVDHCLLRGSPVVAVDDLSGGFASNVDERSVRVWGDLRDPAFVDGVFRDHGPFATVYHLGAYAAEGLSHFIRRYNYQTNLIASINLINASVRTGVDCFVFTSSIAVYGAGQVPMTEDQTPMPEDPYGISKYAVELDLAAARPMFGLNSIIFRPHNVYGERQNLADRYRNVIGIFMNQVMAGKPMTIFGDGSQTRAFSHIDDVAPIIARSPSIAAAHNQVFNIGADAPVTVLELARHVAKAFGVEAEIEFLEARNEVVHAYCDHSRVQEVFGETESVAVSEGVRRMAAWARNVKVGEASRFEAIEVEKNLPGSWR